MSTHPELATVQTGSSFAEQATVERLTGLPVPQVATPANDRAFSGALSGTQKLLKRALDIAVAVPVAVFAAPVMAGIALAVRLDSPGPVIFRQQRLGLNGVPFEILKFRTMTVQENGDVVTQATKGDARVTRLGRVLRRWSLDELPQVFNVLTGEMSLVGPRPHARAHDEYFARRIGHYTLRQRVKPGITGWAQVNGHRGETPTIESMRARVDHDVWYAARAGFALDFEILLRTAFEVFRRRNAY